jgi:hypothetical protein
METRYDLQYDIELKIDAIIDYYNFFPPYTLLIERLCDFFTFDELFCNTDVIKNYYRVMVDLLVEDFLKDTFLDRL